MKIVMTMALAAMLSVSFLPVTTADAKVQLVRKTQTDRCLLLIALCKPAKAEPAKDMKAKKK